MIAERLKAARESKGWSRRDLSTKSGVHYATVADIEEGRNRQPSYEKVVLLARALDIQPEELCPVPERAAPAAV